MSSYRRAWHPGGTYFFTVNLLQRHSNDLLIRHINLLREVIRDVRRRHPFEIHGWVVLPEHLHCVIHWAFNLRLRLRPLHELKHPISRRWRGSFLRGI